MLYLYVRSVLTDKATLSKWDYLHFLPAVISFVSILPYYFESFDKKLEIAQLVFQNPVSHKQINISWLYPSSYNILLRSIFVLFYIVFSAGSIVEYSIKTKKKNVPIEQKNLALNWLICIVFITGLTTFSYFIITKNYYFGNDTKNQINEYSINYLAALSYSLIPIIMLIFPQHLYGIPINRKWVVGAIVSFDPQNTPFKQFTSSEIKIESNSTDPFISVAKTIMEYLQKEKPFVNPDFSIEDLAKSLDIQKHHLYYCFNNIIQIKFTSLRTKMRIDYAKEILLSGDLTLMSMEGIWTKAGFSSRTNFFVSFKEETGLTPLEFIKNKNLGDLLEN
jgi:AraC-like DNA-binding protein